MGRRLALQLANVWTPPAASPLARGREWSGPVVASIAVTIQGPGSLPVAEVTFAHAAALALLPAQGCFHCCNQTAPPPKGHAGAGEWLFEVANHRGEWLPARAAVIEGSSPPTIAVRPVTTVPCKTPRQCWLAAVRYAVNDLAQCALYNAAELPASQFQLPVPWTTPVTPNH